MEGKKISFGFMKTKKVDKLPVIEKKDFIECVEEKSIKVVGGDEIKEVAPLIIPMKPNTLITTERLKEIAEKVESALVEPEIKEEAIKQEIAPENETLEQMAVRELMEESKKTVKVETPQLKLVLPAKSMSSGEKESTLDDYESVPIQDFGLAMLRGMGWTKNNEKSTFKPPQLRPKGLGLGADKVVKDNNKQKVAKNSKDEELTIVKNAYVKITTGKYSGYYGKVVSLDEDNGRVMVDITVKKETVSLSEFMMHPVTKSEFDKESKVINASSYEQYKKNEGKSSKNEKESSRGLERSNKDDQSKVRREGNSSNDNNNHTRGDNEKHNDRERHRDRSNRNRYRDDSEEKNSKLRETSNDSLIESDTENTKMLQKSKKRYSSMESLDSDTEKKSKQRKSKKKDKQRRRHTSDSDTEQNRSKNRHDSDLESEQRNKKNKERKRRDSDSETDKRKSKKGERSRQRYDSDSESDHMLRKKSDKERKRDSDSELEQRISKKDKSRRHDTDSESDHRRRRSDTPEGKRDIDKKRKGKKKKRDRDRSPNYRKHRK